MFASNNLRRGYSRLSVEGTGQRVRHVRYVTVIPNVSTKLRVTRSWLVKQARELRHVFHLLEIMDHLQEFLDAVRGESGVR